MNLPVSFSNLSVEAKSSALFALLALFFSIVLGIINGIGAGTVVMRSILLTLLFAGLGFAVTNVIKKYVPELYGLIAERHLPEEQGTAGAPVEEPSVSQDEVKLSGSPDAAGEEKAAGPAVAPMSDDDFNKLMGEGGADSKRKMGKHIISNEKIVSYEPKIMAQAVRTMMRRDED